jgi:fructokinase
MGAKTVVLTTGGSDIFLHHGGQLQRFAPNPVEVADATGAGDAFWAGFLVAWLDGHDPGRCVLFARQVVERKLSMVGPLPVSINRADLYARLSAAE